MSALYPTAEELRAQITKTRAEIATLMEQGERARARSDAATPGGLEDYDSAVLSGIRRKPNRKADDRRWSAYSKEAEAGRKLHAAQEHLATLERQLKRAEKDESSHKDLTEIGKGDYVRTTSGWHKVVRVNAKSVTVETGYSWTDRIESRRIVETRVAA